MKIGLTGATGFIGKIIKKDMENDGHEVIELRTDEANNYYTLDHLIHCARSDKNITDGNGNLTTNLKPIQWHREFETDISMAYNFTLDMADRNNLKSVIFISSIYGLVIPTVRDIPANYVTAKAAEIHMAKYLAHLLSPITRVNTLILGGIRSIRKVANQNEEFLEKYSKHTLTGEMVQPEYIYPCLKLLIENKGLCGCELICDGGYTC
jgi:NAD(P)-dependent dehydrogenase (short-subunit alcohol dehydrogenase family)